MTIVSPTKEQIDSAATILHKGGIVAFATETVYGLGCDTFNEAAIELIYETKGRPIDNPMIAHVLDSTWVELLTTKWTEQCEKLATTFWPGPLTIVLPKRDTVPASACGGRDTVAIRCPSHPVARKLLASFGSPISAPSANRSGYISPTTATHVEHEFDGLQTVIDGGPCEKGIESTVLSLVDEPTILRPGTVTPEEIEDVIGHVSQPKQTVQSDSPGTTNQHYAPRTNVLLLTTDQMNAVDDEHCVAIHMTNSTPRASRCIQMPNSPEQYGAALYSALRDADQANASCIVIEQPPKTKEWLAIQDRLMRCSANS